MNLDRFNLSSNVVSSIETLVKQHQISYLDAALHFSETSGIELDIIAEIIKKNEVIKAKLEIEAENLNLIRKQSRLPL